MSHRETYYTLKPPHTGLSSDLLLCPGEVSPEQAQTIGMELARRLVGDRFEAVVSTHTDHAHVHCHIVFNSVSCVDVTITQERDDLRRPGTLEVKKQDQNGKPLAGATFLLECSTDNGASWTAVFSHSGDDVLTGGCTSSGLSDGQLSTGDVGSVTFSGIRADSEILYRRQGSAVIAPGWLAFIRARKRSAACL